MKRRGRRKIGREDERVREEWIEEEKGLATLWEVKTSMIVIRLQTGPFHLSAGTV